VSKRAKKDEHAIDAIDRLMSRLMAQKPIRYSRNWGPWLVAAEYLEDWAAWIRVQVDAQEAAVSEAPPPYLLENTPAGLPESLRGTASDNHQQLSTQVRLKPGEIPEKKTEARTTRRGMCPHGGIFGESTDDLDECERCGEYKICEEKYLAVGRE